MCDCPAHRDLVDCVCECDHTNDRLTQWQTRALAAEEHGLDLKVGVMHALGFAVVRDTDDLINVARQLRAERDALKAELAAIHSAVVDVYGENYGGEDVAAEVRRLFTHLVEHEADVRRLRQSKNEALERAQAELAEARASGSHLAEVAADEYLALKAERDAAQAAIERVRAILDQPLLRTSDPERAGERFLARQIAAALDAQGAGRA